MESWPVFVLLIFLSYMVGSIPFGLIVGRLLYGQDIRQQGSGNIGATNVFRSWGLFPALLVISGDLFKGAFVVLIVKIGYSETTISNPVYSTVLVMVAISAILGSTYSLYMKFSGGKGMGCAAGALLVLWPLITLILFIIFILIVSISRYVSLGSLIVAIAFPVLIIYSYSGNLPFIVFSLIASVIVIYKHRDNIRRIFAGTERKLW